MRYFLVVGEASGDLHAASLMREILQADPEADFAYMGGAKMRAVGGTCIQEAEELAVMGILDVIQSYGAIQKAGKKVQQALLAFQPDAVLCVDYSGFCFRYILPFVTKQLPQTKLIYYIPPKVWAWRRGRIKQLQEHCHLVASIFPFEVDYFHQRGLQQARYVGNPTYQQISHFLHTPESATRGDLPERYIALLPGSRESEIRHNLPTMLRVAKDFPDFHIAIAQAPAQPSALYEQIIRASIGATQTPPLLLQDDTLRLTRHATAALVTSGTATLETALLGTPQVVCYAIAGGALPNLVFKHLFQVPYISLVNLLAGTEVVQELFGKNFQADKIWGALAPLLQEGPARSEMLSGYERIQQLLSQESSTPFGSSLVAWLQDL